MSVFNISRGVRYEAAAQRCALASLRALRETKTGHYPLFLFMAVQCKTASDLLCYLCS